MPAPEIILAVMAAAGSVVVWLVRIEHRITKLETLIRAGRHETL